MSQVHIIGAGMAGLAAAVKLAAAGRKIILYESANHAGGRARSFHDENLGCLIDNGNHLLLSGNYAVRDYLNIIDAGDTFFMSENPVFPFLDLKTGQGWTVRPGRGRLPFWLFNKKRGIPGIKTKEYLSALRINRVGRRKTVSECTGKGLLYERFWEPMTLAALNTPAEEASAFLLRATLKETFFRGAKYCRPMIAKAGLSESLVTPALRFIKSKGGEVRLKTRLSGFKFEDAEVRELLFGDRKITLNGDNVILAVTPGAAQTFLPGLLVPTKFHAIVNAHFKLKGASNPSSEILFLGLLGGTAHWLFVRGNIISVTVSAADVLAKKPSEEIARIIWADVTKALGLKGKKLPSYRIIKEKRATFSQTPASRHTRPKTRGQARGLYLAGDWTNTGVPATIEGAVRSGFKAAGAVIVG